MACFWRDLVGTSQTCNTPPPVPPGFTHGLNSIVYMSTVSGQVHLAEVKTDLSIVDHGLVPSGFVVSDTPAAYSKNRYYYSVGYDYTVSPGSSTLYRHQGLAQFATLPVAYPRMSSRDVKSVRPDSGVLRLVSFEDDGSYGFWMSTDGELFERETTSTVSSLTVHNYTKFGSRLVVSVLGGTSLFYYSDNGGASWTAATGAPPPASYTGVVFYQHGGRLIAVDNTANAYATTDGASWSTLVTFRDPGTTPNRIADDGTGRVVVAAARLFYANPTFLISGDYGASWTSISNAAAGIGGATLYGVFHNGTECVALADNGSYQDWLYTSPTGSVWTPIMQIPFIWSANTLTRIIA